MLSLGRTLLLLSLCIGTVFAAEGDANPIQGEQTKIGTLSAKPANAAADVVALLHAGGADYLLAATGASATQVDELLKKSARVQVSGPVNGDKMTVTTIKESTAEVAAADKGTEKDGKKKKGEKKGEKKKKKKQQA